MGKRSGRRWPPKPGRGLHEQLAAWQHDRELEQEQLEDAEAVEQSCRTETGARLVAMILVTPPVCEPVDVLTLRMHLRMRDNDGDEEDPLLLEYIRAATAHAEELTGRSIITQTWAATFDCFPPRGLELWRGPIQEIDKIEYFSPDGELQLPGLDVYHTDLVTEPARISLARGMQWPETALQNGAVIVTYVAGYGDEPWHVPADVRQWITATAAAMFERRESTVTGQTIHAEPISARLLDPYRLIQLA